MMKRSWLGGFFATSLLTIGAAHAQYQPGDVRIDSRDIRTCLRPGCVAPGEQIIPKSTANQPGGPAMLGSDGTISGQSVQVGSGPARPLAGRLGTTSVDPGDYIAAGQTPAQLYSGAIDASPALSAALSAGMVRPPCGTYRLDEPVVVTGGSSKFYLDGGSPGCVTFNVTFVAGDIFGLHTVQRGRVREITVNAVVQRTSGAVFHLFETYDFQSTGVVFQGSHGGDGWLLDGANTTHIERYDCRPPVAFVVGTYGAGACIHGINNAADAHISHGNSASWHYGQQWTWASGIYVDNIDNVLSGNALVFDPSYVAGQSVFGANFTSFYGDTSKGDNFLFQGDGWITDIQLNSPWASNSQSANGFAVNNPRVDGLQISTPTILGNFAAGLSLLQGTNITAVGAHSFYNSRAGSNLWDDIYIGPNVLSAAVEGASVGSGGTQRALGAVPYSRWGLNAPGGGSGQTIVARDIRGIGNITGLTNLPEYMSPNIVLASQAPDAGWKQIAVGVSSTTGALGTAAGIVRYKKTGTTVQMEVTVTVATNGSASGAIQVALPFVNAIGFAAMSGRDFSLGTSVVGSINSSTNVMTVAKTTDNSYPAANGSTLVLSGTYETAN